MCGAMLIQVTPHKCIHDTNCTRIIHIYVYRYRCIHIFAVCMHNYMDEHEHMYRYICIACTYDIHISGCTRGTMDRKVSGRVFNNAANVL